MGLGRPGKVLMRHLLLVTAMFVFGLAITLGTASVLQDVAVARGKSTRGYRIEGGNQMPKPTMKISKQSRSLTTDTSHNSHL